MRMRLVLDYQGWFWVWAQPVRDDVTMSQHLSLAEPIPRIILGMGSVNERRHYSWFPQTLKSAWIWLLSWKVLDFSICLEKWQFSLKSAWKLLFMGLKNNDPTNLIFLCVFCACCMLDFNRLREFGNFIINFPVTTHLVIHIFLMVNIVIRCMASYFITEKCVNEYARSRIDSAWKT